METLKYRLKALDDLNRTSVDVLLRKTNASALNSGSDFDKYVAMQLAEVPVTCASNAHYKKFPYHSLALREIRHCLHKPKDQFKAYFLAVSSNHDYEQVLESLAKVNKSFLEPRSTMPGSATLTCFGCGQIGCTWTTAGFSLTLGVAPHLPDLAQGPSPVNNHFFYVLASYVVHLRVHPMFLHGILLFALGPLFYYGLICSVPSVGARPRFLPSGSRSY